MVIKRTLKKQWWNDDDDCLITNSMIMRQNGKVDDCLLLSPWKERSACLDEPVTSRDSVSTLRNRMTASTKNACAPSWWRGATQRGKSQVVYRLGVCRHRCITLLLQRWGKNCPNSPFSFSAPKDSLCVLIDAIMLKDSSKEKKNTAPVPPDSTFCKRLKEYNGFSWSRNKYVSVCLGIRGYC